MKRLFWLALVCGVAGCGEPRSGMAPAESDKRPPAAAAATRPPLEEALQQKDAVAVGKAIDEIANPKDAIPLLIRGLGNENPDVRETCSEALVKFAPQGKDVVLALIEALQDQDPVVRRHAATALGQIGPPAKEAVPMLDQLQRLEVEQDDVRKAATTALERINTPDGAP